MSEITAQSAESSKERRAGERRTAQRRRTAADYKGPEQRMAKADRRTTILNRLNSEVTDRRSFN